MSNGEVIPELKQILGALIFGANRPLSIKEMRKCLIEVAVESGGAAAPFGKVSEDDIRNALNEFTIEQQKVKNGFMTTEVAGGFRLQSDPSCGRWLKHLLEIGRPNRLSRPALETLAIIAYRQPLTRAEIEAIRGVNVDHIMRALLEMQLIKISGRSELPGKPFQYGTTQAFLEHFGLKQLKELCDMEPMLMAAKELGRREQVAVAVPAVSAQGTDAVEGAEEGSPAGAEGGVEDALQENAKDNKDE